MSASSAEHSVGGVSDVSASANLLKKMATVKVTYLERNEDNKAAEIDKFADALGLNRNFISGDVLYQINKSQHTKLHRPERKRTASSCVITQSTGLES